MPQNEHHWRWALNILIAIDKVGNALTGGSHNNTISARTGYFAGNPSATNALKRWRTLERVIDIAFYPLDGWKHCCKAWKCDGCKTDYEGNNYVLAGLTLFTTIPICILMIAPVTYLVLVFRGPVKGGQWGRRWWHRSIALIFSLPAMCILNAPLAVSIVKCAASFACSFFKAKCYSFIGLVSGYVEWWLSVFNL